MNEATLLEILNFDSQLFLYQNNLGNPTFDAFWLFITNLKSWIPLYVVFIWLLYRKMGLKQTLVVLLFLVLLIVCSDQFTNFLKHHFERLRPCYNPQLEGMLRLVQESCGGKYGFSSAHAANHMALALFLGQVLNPSKGYKRLLLVWALFIGYSRIYVGVHYPIDVFTGFLIGGIFALLIVKIYRIFVRQFSFEVQ